VNARTIAGIAVSVVSLGAVVAWSLRQEAPAFPTQATDWAMLVGAVAIYAVATLARGWRWHVILRLDGIAHKRRDAVGLVCVGYMGNTVLPARGGEVLRTFLLSQRTGARKRFVLGSIVAERLLDAVVLVGLFAALTFAGVAGAPTGRLPALLAVLALIGGAVGLWLYLRARRAGRLEAFAARIRPLVRASRPLLGLTGALLALLTVGVWLLEAVIFVLVGQSLGIELSLMEGLFLDVLASFFALVPAAPGYVGTFDAAVVFGLKALGVVGGTALAFALLVRFVLFVPITAVGLVLLLVFYGGVDAVRNSRRSAEEDVEDVPVDRHERGRHADPRQDEAQRHRRTHALEPERVQGG
jgi:glycosyltransferase 2 family protein